MSTSPHSPEEFDAYLKRVARGSRYTGLAALLGLLLVLGALVVSTRQLMGSQRELDHIEDQVGASRTELNRVTQELRIASDSLIRVREGFNAFAAVVNQQSPGLAQNAARVARDSANAAQVVYIQFRGTISRPLVNELRTVLNTTGFNAPGVERVDRPYRNAVRFFHPQDEATARDLADTTKRFFESRGCNAEFPVSDLTNRGLNARPGQMEIWINLNCGSQAQEE